MNPSQTGAEAQIFIERNRVVKFRPRKSYRIEAIDKALRGFRTRREAKILSMLYEKKFPVPKVLDVSDKTMNISMELIKGLKVRDALDKNNCKKLGEEIGRKVGLLHSYGIIHGDLTTSNMILQKEVYFIDFGLGFFSDKAEDRAVELHLLKETARGTHPSISDDFLKAVMKGYQKSFSGGAAVLERMQTVEERGRNKKKMGS